jgi:hypothetical protein
MKATGNPTDSDDMPAEIDFSGGVRGKFYRPSMTLNVPMLQDIEEGLRDSASGRTVDNGTVRKWFGLLE